MLNHELLNKDLDIYIEEYPLIIFDIKPAMYMAKNIKDTKHTRHIATRMSFFKEWRKMQNVQDCLV